ncbi:MAG: hypothetical protein H2174_01415 [Vampirovibrio sp.]|nr:hypothetical protein [Vampirovibrio sp.]
MAMLPPSQNPNLHPQATVSPSPSVAKTPESSFNINGILTPQTSGETQLDHLLLSINSLPLWIRQVIYTDLRDALEKEMSAKTIKTLDKQHFLQLWDPILATRGKNEILNPSANVSKDVQQLLKFCKNGLNVANICTELHWTLEKCCILLCDTIATGYIEPSISLTIDATMRYLGNKTRLGEYLVQSQRITEEDMEQALLTQQYITVAMGERTNIGEILVRLELVEQEDVEAILFLKEESSKVFRTQM